MYKTNFILVCTLCVHVRYCWEWKLEQCIQLYNFYFNIPNSSPLPLRFISFTTSHFFSFIFCCIFLKPICYFWFAPVHFRSTLLYVHYNVNQNEWVCNHNHNMNHYFFFLFTSIRFYNISISMCFVIQIESIEYVYDICMHCNCICISHITNECLNDLSLIEKWKISGKWKQQISKNENW